MFTTAGKSYLLPPTPICTPKAIGCCHITESIDGAKIVLDVVNVTASLYLFIGNTIIFRVNRVPDESHLILKNESVFLYSLNLKIDTP